MWDGQFSSEVLNLYALVVFLGWAHFTYAWQGQGRQVADSGTADEQLIGAFCWVCS
jgi:hypothetical protein